MDSLIALCGKDFVLMAADTLQARSILALKYDEDKIFDIDGSKMFALGGEHGDRNEFGQYMQKNIKLYTLRFGFNLTTQAIAQFTREELAEAIRKSPYMTNILLGGIDDNVPSLYYLDYLGTMHKVKCGAHGYCSNFVLSIFDRHYKDDLTFDEAMELLNLCISEIHSRFIINQPQFIIKKLDSNGITVVQGPPEESRE